MIGEIVSHYKILEKLGGGGMGVIYKAQDLMLDRFVALKFLPPIFSMNEESKLNIIREAKIAATLEHPNICNIHEVGETEDEQIFIAMAYYEGETLRQKIDNNSISKNDIENILLQIARGLEQAHEKGIIHRDIKPSNIFITKQNEVKILDFGVAKIEGDFSVMDVEKVKGTIAYMSPEQISGEEIDQRCDIWAFGVLMFELVIGHKPFNSEYEQSALFSIISDDPDLSELKSNDNLFHLKNIILKCLQKKKSDRFQSFCEIISLLSEKAIYSENKRLKLPFLYITAGIVSGVILIISGVVFIPDIPTQNDLVETKTERIAVLPCQSLLVDENNIQGISEVIQSLIVGKLTGIEELAVYDHLSLNESLNALFGEKIPRGNSKLSEFLRSRDISYYVDSKLMKVGNTYHLEYCLVETNNLEIIFSTSRTFSKESEISYVTINLVTEILNYFQIKNQFANRAKDLQPWLENGTQNMGSLKAFLTANQYIFHGDQKIAEKYLRRSIELDSTFVSPRISLISTLNWLRKNELAKEEFIRLKPLESNASPFEQAMIEWVYCYINGDKLNEIKHLMVALRYSPQNNMINYNLARAYFVIQDYSKCIDIIKKSVESGWRFSPAYFLLGSSYERIGEYQKAIDIFEKSLSIKPIYPDIYNFLSRVYLLEDDTLNGRKYERLYIAESKESGKDLGFVYAYLGKQNYALDYFPESVEYYKKALFFGKNNPQYHNGFADALLEVSDTISAITEYKKAIKLDKEYFEPQYSLGVIKEINKDYDEAIFYYKNCLEIDSTKSDSVFVQGKLNNLLNKAIVQKEK